MRFIDTYIFYEFRLREENGKMLVKANQTEYFFSCS